MENCRRCGKQLDKGVKMCIECGSKDITNFKNDLGAALVGVPVFGFLFGCLSFYMALSFTIL